MDEKNIVYFIKFYEISFFDLAQATSLQISDSKYNSIEILSYKIFYLSQSFEKLLKSILTYLSPETKVPKIHNLRDLTKCLVDIVGEKFMLSIGSCYKRNLQTKKEQISLSDLQNDFPNLEFTNIKCENSVYFEHLCLSLERGYHFVRYPADVEQDRVNNLIDIDNVILNTLISSHRFLLHTFISNSIQKKLKNYILKDYYGKPDLLEFFFKNFISHFVSLFFGLPKIKKEKSYKEIINVLINDIFVI